MYIFMISCYILMIFNLFNLILCGAMGYSTFLLFGANHAQFSLFAILVFVFTETLVMYFFIATGKSMKTILSDQEYLNREQLWDKVKYIKNIVFPHIMFTILIFGGLYIFYFGYIKSNTSNIPLAYSWLNSPLYLFGLLHHIWSLKIKNDSFKMQIEIISEMSTNLKS